MKFPLKSFAFPISLVFSTIPLLLHGYLGHFTRYMADDFCTAFYAHRLGIFRSTWFWYLNWSGRFSASILDATIGLLGPRVLPVIVPLTILLWLTILTIFFRRRLSPHKNDFLISLALATTTLFTLFLLSPDIRQSLYWGQGMRSVVPPLIMGTIQLILWNYIRAREWTRSQLWFWGVFGFLWAFIAGGFSETYAAFQVAILTVSFLTVWLMQKVKFRHVSPFVVGSFLGAVGALVVVALAPGNSERQAFFPSPPGAVGMFMIALKGYLLYLTTLLGSADKLLAALGLFSLAALAGSQLKQEMNARLLWITPGLTLGCMFLCFLPAAYGTSEAPPGRTLILPTYFFIMGILEWGVICGNFLRKKEPRIASKLLPGIVILTIALSASMNAIRLYQARHEFIDYARRWDETNAIILKSKQNGETQIFIPIAENWASLNTPNDNPRFWVNVCMSRYYDIQILTTADP